MKSPPSGGSEVKKPMPALKGLGLREEEMVIVRIRRRLVIIMGGGV